jgi:hypothetical protein
VEVIRSFKAAALLALTLLVLKRLTVLWAARKNLGR